MCLRFNSLLSNAMRISFGLAMVNVVVLLGAHSLGMLTTSQSVAREQRLQSSQMLASQLSSAIEAGDAEELKRVSSAVLGQLPRLRSLGIRRADDSLLFSSEGHERQWAVQEDKTHAPVQVPLYDGDRKWGQLELVFENTTNIWSAGLTGICVFVACTSLVAFRVFIRRVLKALDPSKVIPERVRAMLDTMAEGAMLLSTDQRIVLTNTRFQELVGGNETPVVGQDPADFEWFDSAGPVVRDTLPWSNLSDGKPHRGIPLRLKRNGTMRLLSVNATPICGENKAVRGMLVTFDDVTAIEEKNTQLELTVRQLNDAQDRVKKQNDELRWMATRDALTGVLNRRAFQEQFIALFENARQTGKPLSLVMIDIDHFKSVNDKHGHATGDEVLKCVSQRLMKCAGIADVVARYGGEEFCVLLPETSEAVAEQFAERTRLALKDSPSAGLNITASFGICSTQTPCENELQLAHFADEALYSSKHNGRDRVSAYSQIAESLGDSAVEAKHSPTIPAEAVSALISALQFRDPQTAAHSRRVSALCVDVMSDIIDRADLKVLEVAALLHDIGKIGVPDSVLLKPGPLTDEERVLMDTHDRIGIAILESSFKHEEVAAIVRAHHAHFDGSGARCGTLRGAEIPLRARILSIADAYDAMVDNRPYRKAMTQDAAIAELQRCAGTQFDPMLVERFVAFIEKQQCPTNDRIDSLLRLGIEVERLSAAIVRNDLLSAQAIAQRLHAVSISIGNASLASVAAQVASTLRQSKDATTILGQVHQLLDTYSESFKSTSLRLPRAA